MRSADGTEATDEAFEAMLARVVAAGKKTGTPTGMHVMSPEVAHQRAAQGMQFIAVASELRMMTEQATKTIQALGLGGGKDLARY
jgi:4-hydroxy-2-oxoheptanedioate aldolase